MAPVNQHSTETAASAGPPPAVAPLVPDYELLRPIGQGGYGEVWLARGLTGLYRAVKVVRRDRFNDSEPFDREFRGLTEFAAIALGEPGQVALLHIGRDRAHTYFYYVMELADDVDTGRAIDVDRYVPHTLDSALRKRRRMPIAECVTLGIEIARGLKALHSQGLVHRDVKPSNIIFVAGKAKLADIGLVTPATAARTFAGTEGFIPPEGPGTRAGDVYSLGKVLYELSTGQDRKNFPALPPNFDQLPDRRLLLELNEIVLKACESDPNRRYADADALLADLCTLEGGSSVRRKHSMERIGRFMLRAAAVLALLAACTATAIWLKHSTARSASTPAKRAPLAHGIAVLPFADMSDGGSDSFFAEGVHEDLILRLAKIRTLTVISRTSVTAYKAAARNLREIAAELGVANIVEGTVQRKDGHVRLTARLISAQDDRTLWAETYDRRLTDTFSIQAELAREISSALRAKISPSEQRFIAQHPTQNSEAYDLYLQARWKYQSVGFYGRKEDYDEIVQLYQRAIAQDPQFAQAYVQLSLVHSSLYRFARLDPRPQRLQLAQDAIAAALRLDPELPEAKLARGVITYLGESDWQAALQDFRAAEQHLPNDDQVQWWLGNALRRIGRWHEAVDYFVSSSVLNPRAPAGGITAVQTLRFLRRHDRARELLRDYLNRFPRNRVLQMELARLEFERDGDRKAFLRRIDALPVEEKRPASEQAREAYEVAVWHHDWPAAEQALADPALQGIVELPAYIDAPVSLHRAQIAFLKGERPLSVTHAVEALAAYDRMEGNSRQLPWIQMGRARAEALLGQADDARRHAEAAWTAVSDDATAALAMRPLLAQVYIMLGRHHDALTVLRELVRGPATLGPQALRWDPYWKKVQQDPLFEELLREAKPL